MNEPIELKVQGMSCNHCVASVKGALEKVPGVRSAEVHLADGRAEVNGDVEPAALVAAVEAEGYAATAV